MSAPVLLSVAAAALALALPVTSAAAALDASARAAGAADAAALAAADAAVGWIAVEPCAIARQVAEAANSALDQCEVDTSTGQARVRVSAPTFFGAVYARARAGPP